MSNIIAVNRELPVYLRHIIGHSFLGSFWQFPPDQVVKAIRMSYHSATLISVELSKFIDLKKHGFILFQKIHNSKWHYFLTYTGLGKIEF